MPTSIYFLPGHGGRISNGLGQELARRGFDVLGRETIGDFKKLDFDARVIANSYGAYLLLLALSSLTTFPGKILLLSPIVGEFSNDQTRIGFIPPYANRLHALASKGLYPIPNNCQIHVGSQDWQSIPDNVTAFAALIHAQVTVLEGAGHSLPKEYVASLLDNWLI